MLAPRAILHQAHDEAVALFGLNYDCGHFFLGELNEGFNPTMPANYVVACRTVLCLSGAHRNRSFQAHARNALHDLLEVSSISNSRIQKAYLVNRNSLDLFRCNFAL